MTYNVSSGTLKLAHSLTHSLVSWLDAIHLSVMCWLLPLSYY